MNNRVMSRLCVAVLFFPCGEIQEIHKACHDYSNISLVHYAIGARHHDASSPPALILQVSVSPKQAGDKASLLRLGCQLDADFPKEAAIQAWIFDDREAAERLLLYAQDQRDHGTYLWHLRARYELNRRQKRQVIDFLVPQVEDGLLAIKKFRTWIDF